MTNHNESGSGNSGALRWLKRFLGIGRMSRRRRNREKISALHREMQARREAQTDREVPRREMLVGAFAAINLIATPWMLGGQPLWANVISVVLAMMAFAFLFLPVRDAGDVISASPRESLYRVTRSFPFWAGLVLLGLFLIQGLNPRLEVMFDGALWQLMPVSGVIDWLPSGVRAPFVHEGVPGGMNAFRTMLLFTAPWLLFTALWCGVRSRRVIRVIAWLTLISALCAAIFAMSMRALGTSYVFAGIAPGTASPYGPFLYQNQAGAFFYLVFLFSVSVALREWLRSAKMDRRGGPQLIALCICICLLATALMSASFAAVTVVIVSIIPVIIAVVLTSFRAKGETPTTMADLMPNFILIGILVIGFSLLVVRQGNFTEMARRVEEKLARSREDTLDDRRGLRNATRMMYKDVSPMTGAGAGSYRWVAPEYLRRIPEFCDAQGVQDKTALYAHCDWLQMLAEWGAFGLSVFVSGLLWAFWRAREVLSVENASQWPLFAGLMAVVLHAGIDYLFFNPALAVTIVFLGYYLMNSLRKVSDA